MKHKNVRLMALAAFIAAGASSGHAARAAQLNSFIVCADPGNMPLSNQKGEGFENKIAQVIGKDLGTGVQYYWRPSVERGLMRTTLSAGNCDVWMDMATDTEGAEVLTPPLYRSTFVLAYRNDRGIDIKSLDDAALKKLRVGVFEVSAIREALMEHHVVSNTVIHYVSHNADLVPENQPSYQVQQVIDGSLDIAAVWGPMAGYYQTVEHAPLVIKPVNLMEDEVPMEFDMSLAIPRGRPDIKQAVEGALERNKAEIKQILIDYGVPLVECQECLISGDLPSHGPYKALPPTGPTKAQIAAEHRERMAELKRWLAQGADPDSELGDAIVANDIARVRYLLAHGAHPNARDGEGYTPLINATRFNFVQVATYLAEHKADVNIGDRTDWTPLMYAAWQDDPDLVSMLVRHGAKIDAVDSDGLTPLAIAAQNGKAKAAEALVLAGSDVNAPVAKGGYTPLMLAAISGSSDLATALIDHGAKVNAVNPGGVTALMIAAANNHPILAELLIKSGADLGARSQDGRTALGIAQANNDEAMVKLLQQAAQKAGASASG
ncbi:MAG TPA: quinoprotein dehydrogenase-associated putative ABC transporter substrate-binding protein [Steroidobacteraceae bacterium]|nr:quinoprotein dehydrogenase-associated putative ABC transporter substrate-binding protein [Steroidobacteraceae bacterium]